MAVLAHVIVTGFQNESSRCSRRFEDEVGTWRVGNGKRIDHAFATGVWDNRLTLDTSRLFPTT
jgi:hypothetical protein